MVERWINEALRLSGTHFCISELQPEEKINFSIMTTMPIVNAILQFPETPCPECFTWRLIKTDMGFSKSVNQSHTDF
jgi:hypothetical protein